MGSNIEIVYGVCVDNNDPHNAQRIRILLLGDMDSIRRTSKEALNIVLSNDSKGNYTPWEFSSDPYLADCFLPKYVNMIPDPGQLVKLIIYADPRRIEYMGGIISDNIQTNQGFLGALQKTRENNNYQKGLTSGLRKFPISGKNGEQIILGNDEIITRLNHITPQQTKAVNYAFTQLTEYPITININTQTEQTLSQSQFLIDFVWTVDLQYNQKTSNDDKNIVGVIKIYDGQNIINNGLKGLRNTDVSFNPNFQSDLKSEILKFTLKSGNIQKFINEFENIIISFKNKNIYKFPKTTTSNTLLFMDDFIELEISNDYSFLPNSGGVVSEIKNEIMVDNFLILKNKDQIDYLSLSDSEIGNRFGVFKSDFDKNSISPSGQNWFAFDRLSNYIHDGLYQNIYTQLQNTETITTQSVDITQSTNNSESVYMVHADKMLLYSTILNEGLSSTTPGIDGADHEKLAEIFRDTGSTDDKFKIGHPIIRGDKMFALMKLLVDVILNHGHKIGVNPPDSLDDTSRNSLNDLIQSMEKDLQDASGSQILNHYIRTN